MQRFSGHLIESNHMGSLPRRGPHMSTLWKRIHCMQFISVLPRRSSMLSLKDQIICKAVLAHKRLTIIGNYKTQVPQKVRLRSLTRGSNFTALNEKILLFWACDAYWRQSPRGVVVHGGSIVIK